jgi:hypothetical protein
VGQSRKFLLIFYNPIVVQYIPNEIAVGTIEFVPINNISKPIRLGTENIVACCESYVLARSVKKVSVSHLSAYL